MTYNQSRARKQKDPSACNTVVAGAYNPLFKVLCIFPSRYLFAIGLEKIFSFGWNVPSALRSHPRERDSAPASGTIARRVRAGAGRDCHPSLCLVPEDAHQFRRAVRTRPRDYTATGNPPLVGVSSSFFIRHYLKNPLSFLFHHLLICLNSEGNFS